MEIHQTLFNDTIGGHHVSIRQHMIDISPTSNAWEGQGPFVPGLKTAFIDDQKVSPQELRALLSTAGRDDLVRQFEIP